MSKELSLDLPLMLRGTCFMSYRNVDLYESVKSYVKAAIYLLKESDSDSFLPDLPISRFIFRREEIEALPEYQECLLILKKDPVIFDQFNEMVGVGLAGSRSVPVETFMLHIPQLLGIYNELFEFNEVLFEMEYAKLEDTFYNDEITFEVIVPLQGPRFSEPVMLENNLEIVWVNSKNLKSVLDKGINGLDECWAIRTSYSLPKRIGDRKSNLEEEKENDAIRELTNESAERVIIALRVFCNFTYNYCHIYPATILHRATSLLFPRVRPFRIRYAPDYSFTSIYEKEFTEPFQKFWRMFGAQGVMDRRFIGVAARRFSFAHERYNWQDKIIDLLIAAEALFFCDQGEKSELSYRLCLRASFF